MIKTYTKGEYRTPMVKIVAVAPICTICNDSLQYAPGGDTEGLTVTDGGYWDE